MNIPSKSILTKNYFINSMNKSNLSTSNFSPIIPDKNYQTIEPYENFNENIKFMPNSPQTGTFVSSYMNNTYNINSNQTSSLTPLISKNNISPKKGFIYTRKKMKNMNLNNQSNHIYLNKGLLLNDYRKRIMKLFLTSFRIYYMNYIRKHFYCFIRNITYYIMKKELFDGTNTVMRTKKIKIDKLKNISLSKSYDNLQILREDNLENNDYFIRKNDFINESINLCSINNNKDVHNIKYKTIKRDIYQNNSANRDYIQNSFEDCKIINTKGKVYDFKNVFISSNKKKNKDGIIAQKRNKFRCFIKKVKDIITKDKRVFIRINYIYMIPKKQRKLRNIYEKNLHKINKLLEETKIYSYEYLSNKNNDLISEEFNNEEKINTLVGFIMDVFIFKQKKVLIYKLKLINLIKCIEKFIKIIFFNKLALSMKDNTFSNDNFLLDNKMDINIDNLNELNNGNNI